MSAKGIAIKEQLLTVIKIMKTLGCFHYRGSKVMVYGNATLGTYKVGFCME